jgi:hypothetical protein
MNNLPIRLCDLNSNKLNLVFEHLTDQHYPLFTHFTLNKKIHRLALRKQPITQIWQVYDLVQNTSDASMFGLPTSYRNMYIQ